jgi:hypothetical protein
VSLEVAEACLAHAKTSVAAAYADGKAAANVIELQGRRA